MKIRAPIAALFALVASSMSACAEAPAVTHSGSVTFANASVVGRASVIDGDTLDIHGQRIRLYGIDAFEMGQRCRSEANDALRCGRAAADALDAIIGGQTVACWENDRDRWGRVIARCATRDVADLSEALVAQGWAVAFTRYSTRYVAQEEAARADRRGAWAGDFDTPSDWRAGRRTQASL